MQKNDNTKAFCTPLASNQKDIWFDQKAYPDSPLYNIGGYLRINGQVDYEIMTTAINSLIQESDALRTSFREDRDSILQCVQEYAPYELQRIDFSNKQNPENEAIDWIRKKFQQPFALGEDVPLWNFALLKIHSQCFFLMTQYHHLIADGWTTKIVISRLAEFYNALFLNESPASPPKRTYSDYVSQEQGYLNSDAYHKDEAYWNDVIAELPQPLIKNKQNNDQAISDNNVVFPKAVIHRFFLKRDFYDAINHFSRDHGVSAYHVILSALTIYLLRVYQRDDMVFGIPSLNRNGARYKDVVGMFISLSPLCLSVHRNDTIQDLLKKCAAILRQHYRHQKFPLGQINRRLGVMQSRRNSLFDLVVSYEKQDYSKPFGDAKISAHQQFCGIARYPLAVTICEFHEQHDVEIVLEGANTIFSDVELEHLGQRLTLILKQMIVNPKQSLKDVAILSSSDKKILSEQYNINTIISTFSDSVVGLFQQQVIAHPELIALEDEKEKLSYRQLDECSNQLAHYLISLGARQEQIIAVSLSRGKQMIIALLAILKSGAAYLPIDPDSPLERVSSMLEQSRAMAFISTTDYKKIFSSLHPASLFLDDINNQLQGFSKHPTHVNIKDTDLAYVIFTSGSSGRPKGVLLEHGAFFRRLKGLANLFAVDVTDRVGQTVQFSFDPSIIEIFLPLIQGGRLVLAPDYYQTPEDMAKFVVAKKITMMAMVPSGLRALLQGLSSNLDVSSEMTSALKTVCCGGEILPSDLAKQFISKTGARLFNVYGPTETVILATAWKCSEVDCEPLPIGQPIDDSCIEIVDRENKNLPPGAKGEIVIGGIAGRGYLNEKGFTQEKFFSRSGIRYYKTGDKGYIGFDGQLYFSGRFDRQVKISGYRIEPGEIETVIEALQVVRLAAVKPFEEHNNIVLYAFIEFELDISSNHSQSEKHIKEVSALLRKALPEYMQPRAIVPMEKIPQLSNGKIDYTSLVQLQTGHLEHDHKLPRSQLEAHLMQCWEEVLGTHDLGVRDNFFELGGDSLSAIKLIKKLESIAGHHCSLSFLLEYPTIEHQAEALAKERPSIAVPLLTTLSKFDKAPPFYLAASGQGDAIRFANLAGELGDVCSLHMLQPSGTSVERKTIEEMAMSYAELILIRDDAPGYIGGFSIGGITALETARIMSDKGKPPLGVLLLDTVYPHRLLKSSVLYSFLRLVASFPFLNKVTINGRRLETMLADPGIRTQLIALRKYELKSYDGDVALFVSSELWGKCWCFLKWKQVFGEKLEHYSISGMHGSIFQSPHLDKLTQAIRGYFNRHH